MRKGDDLMGKNVGELSEIDLKNLIEEYYMGVKTDELIRKYDLNCNSTSIYKYFPPILSVNFVEVLWLWIGYPKQKVNYLEIKKNYIVQYVVISLIYKNVTVRIATKKERKNWKKKEI